MRRSLDTTDPRQAFLTLTQLALGDVLTLPDGRHLTVRAIEPKLSSSVGSMAGFVLGGEIGPDATLVSIPTSPDGSVSLYAPLDHLPERAKNARPMCEGVVSYWAPHLPNMSGAMGELGYKVCVIRGQFDPMVLIWRGRERVVFIQTAVTTLSELGMTMLKRDPRATEVDQARHGAHVHSPAHAPVYDPVHEKKLAPSRGR